MKKTNKQRMITTSILYVLFVTLILTIIGQYDLSVSLYLTKHANPYITYFGSRIGLLPAAIVASFSSAVLSKKTERYKKTLLCASYILSLVAAIQWVGSIETMIKILSIILLSILIFSMIYKGSLKVQPKNQVQWNIFLAGIFIPLYANLATKLLKFLWGRPRFLSMQDPLREFVPWYHVSGFAIRNDLLQSFPSGHTTAATCLLWLLLLPIGYPKWKNNNCLLVVIISAWIFVTAISRIMLGKHFLTDVSAGFAISFLNFWLVKKYYFSNVESQ